VDRSVVVDVTAATGVTVTGILDGRTERRAAVTLVPGPHTIGAGTDLAFPAGAAVPQPAGAVADGSGGRAWGRPLNGSPGQHPLYADYGLILATFLGAMGLPHVVVRFYTSPDGRAARRTTLVVLALLGAFYLLPPLYGALSRIYVPDLVLSGNTDTAILVLPQRLVGGTAGRLLSAVLVGGAFAAFLSTASGLTVSIAGVLSQDVLPSVGVRSFRWATLLAVAVPTACTLAVPGLPLADAVALAFAVAASSFCPLLLLGIWWRRLTPPGAIAGILAGGGSAVCAVLATMGGLYSGGWPAALLAWPAVWSVPTGFLVMVLVSLATAGSVPPGTEATLARLHLPEATPALPPSRSHSPAGRP
jgi:Na+(H+)/acetate symporter ActP